MTLPLNIIDVPTELRLDGFSIERVGPKGSLTPLTALESLVNIISESCEVKELVWSPIAAYDRTVSAQVLNDFEQKLTYWRNKHVELVPELDTDSALDVLLVYGWSKFAMPPLPYTSISRSKSLAAAHYNFYSARIKWALVLLEDDVPRNKPAAEFYFYEALRHAASHARLLNAGENNRDIYIPCESLKVGLLPVLHIIGLCSPQPVWLEWIRDLSDQIVQEGVLKGHTFATNLEPAERVICQLIPETDGRHFTSFFAAPSAADNWRHTGLSAYHVIGSARWRCNYGEAPCTPVINMYDSDDSDLERFSTEWLYSTRPAVEWLSRSQEKEFLIEQALQDHISGTRLLLAADDLVANRQVDM
jgi:hypothetical protein